MAQIKKERQFIYKRISEGSQNGPGGELTTSPDPSMLTAPRAGITKAGRP